MKKNMFVKYMFLILALLASFCSFKVFAQEKTLKVGVALGDPFVIALNNEYSGIAIDIWKQFAEENNLKYQFIPMGELIDDSVKNLAEGKIDLLIGPIVPTFDRSKIVDFTQPYYLNQIGLIVAVKELDFLDAMQSIINSDATYAVIVFLFIFTFYLHVFWYYERKTDDRINKSYLVGMKNTFWLHTLDIDLGLLPSHPNTRFVRFFWLILLTLFFSSITAAITSALTVALSSQYVNYDNLNDFRNKKVAGVISTAPYDIAKEMGLNVVSTKSREQALDLLLKGKVIAVVDYYPIADYYLKQHQLNDRLTMANVNIKRDTFAFAVPMNSPLRLKLNLNLSAHQDLGSIKTICERYFGDDNKASINCEI